MTAGRLIAVVGPSGVGKDSLIAALCGQRPDLHPVRRVITRAAALDDEPFQPVSEAQFRQLSEDGGFCLQWPAHGLLYGIPAEMRDRIAAGQDCIVNLSRAILPLAHRHFPSLLVLSVSARPETLARRLRHRGRESDADIAARLARQPPALPPDLPVIAIANDGSLDAATRQALAALYPVRA